MNADSWWIILLGSTSISLWAGWLALRGIGGRLPEFLSSTGRRLRQSGRQSGRERRQVQDDFPFFIDLVVIGLESGNSLVSSIDHAVRLGPHGTLRREFEWLLERQRSGRTVREVLEEFGLNGGTPAHDSFASACATAQLHGSDLAQILRELAMQLREHILLDAEQRALKAPVRMIAPLVLCIFPCTFVVLAFPIAYRLMKEGFL